MTPTEKKIDPSFWVFLVYFFGFFLLYKLTATVMGALLFGWYLSLIIEVPANFLSRIKGVSFKLATVISSLVIFSLMAYAFYQVIPILLDEGKKIFPMITQAAEDLQLNMMGENTRIDPKVIEWVENFTSDLVTRFSEFGVNIINWIIQNIPNAMTATLLFIVTASYFTALTPILKGNIWRFFPSSTRAKAIAFMKDYYRDIRHFIGGQVIIAVTVGTLVGVGMFLSGVPYSLFLGFLSGITNFIPFVGVFVASIPSLLLGFTHGSFGGVIKVIIVLVVVNQLESWVLAPRIQGQRMKLNWFAIVVAIFLCGAFFGVVGVLLAIPLLIFFRNFWSQYVQEMFKRL